MCTRDSPDHHQYRLHKPLDFKYFSSLLLFYLNRKNRIGWGWTVIHCNDFDGFLSQHISEVLDDDKNPTRSYRWREWTEEDWKLQLALATAVSWTS